MVLTASSITHKNNNLSDFELLNTTKNKVENTSNYYGKKGTLVIFMCNHCPYVIHLLEHMIRFCKKLKKNDISTVAFSSNDIINYPLDSPQKMNLLTKKKGIDFPYFYDKNQEVAHYFHALCTPEFYLYDKNQKLFYHGRYDKSRPNNNIEITGEDLKNAVNKLNKNFKSKFLQFPSMGCNIKWIKGNEPKYD